MLAVTSKFLSNNNVWSQVKGLFYTHRILVKEVISMSPFEQLLICPAFTRKGLAIAQSKVHDLLLARNCLFLCIKTQGKA